MWGCVCVCFARTVHVAEDKSSRCSSQVPLSHGRGFSTSCVEAESSALALEASPGQHILLYPKVLLPAPQGTCSFPLVILRRLFTAVLGCGEGAAAETLCFATCVNTVVGWESPPPGKKAPAMSFLAYYKEARIYQYRELFLLQKHVNK